MGLGVVGEEVAGDHRAGGSALADPFLAPARAVLAPDEIAEAEWRAAAPLEAAP